MMAGAKRRPAGLVALQGGFQLVAVAWLGIAIADLCGVDGVLRRYSIVTGGLFQLMFWPWWFWIRRIQRAERVETPAPVHPRVE